MLKKMTALLLCLCMVFALVACGGNSGSSTNSNTDKAPTTEDKTDTTTPPVEDEFGIGSEPITLRFAWQTSGNRCEQVYADVVQSIMDDYPNVTIEVENAAVGEYQTKIALDVSSGNTPDWFQYMRPESSYGMDKFIAAGAIADLSELLDDPYFADQFQEFAVSTGTVNGTLYGVPNSYNFITMIANKDIFDKCNLELPETWEDWLNCNKVLKENGYYTFSLSTKPYAFAAERLLEYCLTRFCTKPEDKELGVAYINNRVLEMFAGNEPFNTPEAIKACEAFVELCANTVAPDTVTMDDAQTCAKYFNTEKAAVYVISQSGLPNMDPALYDKLVALRFPEIPGAQENGPICDADLITLFYASSAAWNDPAKKAVVYEMMKRMTSPEIHDRMTNEAAEIAPTNVNYLNPETAIPVMIEAKEISDASQQVKWLFGRAIPERKELFYSEFTKAWFGEYTGEEFAMICHDIFYNG